jgi:hypothetical protein
MPIWEGYAMREIKGRFKNEDFTISAFLDADDGNYYIELIHFQYGDNIILKITDSPKEAYFCIAGTIGKLLRNPPATITDAYGRAFQQYDNGVGRLWDTMIKNFGRP